MRGEGTGGDQPALTPFALLPLLALYRLCQDLLVMHEQAIGEVGMIAVEPQVVQLGRRVC